MLVVDDELILRRMFERLFTRDGHKVELAATGTEAMARLRAGEFDLLLLDKNLPPPDGVELAIAGRKKLPEAVIVILTGYASKDSAERLVGVADEYIPKPFEIDHVGALLTALMNKRRRKPLPQPRRQVPVVQLLVDSPIEAQRLSARVKALGFGLSTEKDVGQVKPDVLVLEADQCSFQVRQAIWKHQAEAPHFRVVLIMEPGSMSDSMAAVAVKAAFRLVHPFEDSAVDQILAQAVK